MTLIRPAADDDGWLPTWAHVRAVVLGLLGLFVAIIVHRPDLLVIGSPLLVIAVWSVLTRPQGAPTVTAAIGRRRLREGEATTARYTVSAPPGASEVSVSSAAAPWVETRPAHGAALHAVDAAAPMTSVDLTVRMTRWGQHVVGPAAVGALSSWGAYQWGPTTTPSWTVEVMPAAAIFDGQAPMPHPHGLVGIDRAARPGAGSEFASIRPFQLGDRLRRIHWPSSLRSEGLNVTATYADNDSQVIVVIDARNDIGVSRGIDGTPSSLDATVRAAAALCEHHVRRGDRVGLQVTQARRPLVVRPATGMPHLRRMLAAMARIEPGGADDERADARMRIDAGALVLMCSPLISTIPMQRAVALTRRGLVLVVVDTLPPAVEHHVDPADRDRETTELAWRIRLLERSADIRSITRAGVPVVNWRGPGSLDQVLRDVTRRARAPRMAAR